jgi:hypothetical protein
MTTHAETIAPISLRRDPGFKIELRIDVDDCLTRREMHRDAPGPAEDVQLVLPLASISDLIRALDAVWAGQVGR